MSHTPDEPQPPTSGHQPPQYNPQQQGQPHPQQGQYYQAGPQGQYYPPQQPPKKRSGLLKWGLGCLGLIVLVIIVVVACTAIVATGGDSEGGESNSQAQDNAAQDVAEETVDADMATLEVESTGEASVTYGPIGTANTADASGAWSMEVEAPDDDTLSLTVQDMSMSDTAEVTCRMTIDGEVVAEETATGAAAIATCSQPLF